MNATPVPYKSRKRVKLLPVVLPVELRDVWHRGRIRTFTIGLREFVCLSRWVRPSVSRHLINRIDAAVRTSHTSELLRALSAELQVRKFRVSGPGGIRTHDHALRGVCMLLPLGTHRHIEPTDCFAFTSHLNQPSRSAAHPPAQVAQAISPPDLRRTKQTGGKESNLHPAAYGRRGNQVCKLLPLGAGR